MSNRQTAKIVSLPLYPTTAPAAGPSTPSREPAAVLAEAVEPVAAADFEALRRRAAGEHGRRFWRSINELADTPEFAEYVHREFPQQAGEWHDPVSRRKFVKLMGASLALAGVGVNVGCEQREEKIVPYVYPPENIVPGKPLFYATAMPFRAGQGIGLLVEQHMGRPTKIEGNPEHPASLGATDAMAQASVLSLYDPDRSQVVMEAGQITTWSIFFNRMAEVLYENGKPRANLRVRVLTETVCSPTLGGQIRALLKQFPQGRWHQYEPINRDNVNAGARAAFGPATNTVYDFSKAERILSLDCNFLHDEPGSIRYARQFIDGRRVRAHDDGKGHKTLHRETATKRMSEMKPVEGGFEMNRLYVAESTPTITGAMADHRVALKPSQVHDLAAAIAKAVGVQGIDAVGPLSDVARQFADAVAQDLKEHAGRSIIIAGDHQPAAVHVLAHAMNAALKNAGTTVLYTDPVEVEPMADVDATGKQGKPLQVDSLNALVTDMNAGNVDVLLMLGGNPVYTAPADLEFTAALDKFVSAKVQDDRTGKQRFKYLAIHLSGYYDETSFRCHWHLPESHYLESWGDLRAFDGTVSVQQPLIAPLYATRSAIETVAGVMQNRDATGYDLVRDTWRNQPGMAGANFEQNWNKALHDGVVPNTAARVRQTQPLASNIASAMAAVKAPSGGSGVEIVFRPDPYLWDGRWANNGWLQELPKPLTKITWDNVILMSPRTAEQKYGITHPNPDDRHVPIFTIRRGKRQVERCPVWISYGHPDDSITVHLGFGRNRAGRVGGTGEEGHGFDAFRIRESNAMGFAVDAELGEPNKGDDYEIACTQHHQLIDFRKVDAGFSPYAGENLNEQRDLVRLLDYNTYKSEHGAHGHHPTHLSLYPDYAYDTNGLHKWGMVIDQTACIGCNACVAACQSENNIAIVGKEQVIMQRELHWLRIDTYYTGDPVTPDMLFQPMLCQHCEQAPCEVVCPVAATSHSDEGINEMTYNRCVGTRYCSNNCPYKVRRFNFLQYNDNTVASLKLMRNPDVTVRNRGVMEKCTFCVQRVNQTRIELKKLDAEAKAIAADDPAAPARIHEKAAEALADLQTACQQACPTEAIVFGDLNYQGKVQTPNKRVLTVQALKAQPDDLHYGLLTELNTRPRTTYLARFRNLNPALPAPAGEVKQTGQEAGAAHG